MAKGIAFDFGDKENGLAEINKLIDEFDPIYKNDGV